MSATPSHLSRAAAMLIAVFPFIIIAFFHLPLASAQTALSAPPESLPSPTIPNRPAAAPTPAVPILPAGHGWLMTPTSQGTLLLHLPPRDSGGAAVSTGLPLRAPGNSASAEGTIRLAPGTPDIAEHIAWWQNRVYLLMRPRPIPTRPGLPGPVVMRREIDSLAAVRSVGGAWEYPPGRLEPAASLPGRPTDIAAFAACRLGPVVLLRHGTGSKWLVPTLARSDGLLSPSVVEKTTATPGDLELVVLGAGSTPWRRCNLPWGEVTTSSEPPTTKPGRTASYWMQGSGDELLMYVADGGGSAGGDAARMYTARLPTSTPPPDQSTLTLHWAAATLPLVQQAGAAELSLPRPDFIRRVDGANIAGIYSPSEHDLRLFWLRPDRPPEESAGLFNIPRLHSVVPLDGSGRLCILWAGSIPANPDSSVVIPPPQIGGGGGNNQTGLEIREVSAFTGKVLYSGALKTDFGLSLREYQLLSIMLVLVMASVVIFVLRAEPKGLSLLPTGVSLAEPGRRSLATLIDFIPSALLVEALLALPPGTLLLPSQVAMEQVTAGALLAALAVSAAHATLSEWLFGRSIGKLLTGCVVASVRRRPVPEQHPAPIPEGAPAPSTDTDLPARPVIALSRLALWQCLVRNLLKWSAPILGVFILFDPSRRHPGDLLAKTLVLRAPPPPRP